MGAAPQSPALTVHVRPRAGRTQVLGLRADGSLDVAVRAAPAGGEANRELLRLLARTFGVPRSAVALVRGLAARTKVVRIEGLSRSTLAAIKQKGESVR